MKIRNLYKLAQYLAKLGSSLNTYFMIYMSLNPN